MDIAYLGKEGGKNSGATIYAHEADYRDYQGLLRCTACTKLVFLRKAHTDKNGRHRPDMFVHFRMGENDEQCDLRVKNYTRNDIERLFAESRGQRLSKIRISLWKYLKTNLVLSLNNYPEFVRYTKTHSFAAGAVEQGMIILESYGNTIIELTLENVKSVMLNPNSQLSLFKEIQFFVGSFIDERRRNWNLHCEITKEVLDIFLRNTEMKELRYRLACCLFHPSTINSLPKEMIPTENDSGEWQEKFLGYLSFQIVLIFLSVNWIKIFSE